MWGPGGGNGEPLMITRSGERALRLGCLWEWRSSRISCLLGHAGTGWEEPDVPPTRWPERPSTWQGLSPRHAEKEISSSSGLVYRM